ncbi:MAG TPA: hypothetical protein PKD52_09095 [Clostridiales bacterium]|nr:hypothetical protein [Clostridiales bacterium]
MKWKRVTLLAGHYGSGKTNIAVNLALAQKRAGFEVAIADLDIVNPYYRTKDSEKELKAAGVELISSPFANSNVELPGLPQELYRIVDDQDCHMVVDIGGDDRGAYALGRFASRLKEENDYEMCLVLNRYRPLTADAKDAVAVMREIEAAGHLPFTALINNSNLGAATQPEDVLSSVAYAAKISKETGLPLLLTTVWEEIYGALAGKIADLYPLQLQRKRLWL